MIPPAAMSEMFNRNAIGARQSFNHLAHADGVGVKQPNRPRER